MCTVLPSASISSFVLERSLLKWLGTDAARCKQQESNQRPCHAMHSPPLRLPAQRLKDTLGNGSLRGITGVPSASSAILANICVPRCNPNAQLPKAEVKGEKHKDHPKQHS